MRKSPDKLIEFPVDEVKRLAGLDLPLPEMKRILDKLGFFVAGTGKVVKVAVPSWRPDVEGKADIVEEVVRIAGVDRVPLDRIPARRRAAQTRAHVGATALRKAKRALAARGLVEAVTWSFISKPQAELFGGGTAGARARQSDRVGPVRHAAEPDSGPRHRRAEECRSRLSRCRPVRGRADFQGRPAAGSVHRRLRRAARLVEGRRHRPSLAERRRAKGADVFDAKADALAALAAAGAPMQALQIVPGGPGLVSSRPQRHHPDWSAECPWPFRRIASARAGRARRRRPDRRVRGDPREDPRAEGEADARQADARTVGVPAGDARLSRSSSMRASRPPTSCAPRRMSTRS